MSHVTTVKIKITDLAALATAAAALGATFVHNVRTYKWFGVSVGDYPLPPGISKDQLGKCDHVIRVPGVEYEVGVVRVQGKTPQSPQYTLAWDFWGPGRGLHEKFGDGCRKLCQGYAVEATKNVAKAQGYTCQITKLPNGIQKLTLIRP